MRWFTKRSTHQPVSDSCTRVCSGFLFFPKKIEGETRWLEFAVWVEKIHDDYEMGHYWYPSSWRNK